LTMKYGAMLHRAVTLGIAYSRISHDPPLRIQAMAIWTPNARIAREARANSPAQVRRLHPMGGQPSRT